MWIQISGRIKTKELFDSGYPNLKIDLETGIVESFCLDCENWFEINYFHDCNRFLNGPNYCMSCAIKRRNKNSSKARRENYIKYLSDLLQDFPRYILNLETEDVFYKCDNCDDLYIIDQNNLGKYLKQEKHYCQKCRNEIKIENLLKTSLGPGICSHCKKEVEIRYPGCLCYECHSRKNKIQVYKNMNRDNCTICKRNVSICGSLDAAGKCKDCCSKLAKQIRKEKYCNECDNITPHNGNICLICNPESRPNNILPNYLNIDGIEYILNILENRYEQIDEFYSRYQEKISSVNLSDEIQNLINNEGFTLEPIITTGSDSWSRSQTDKYLSDKGYGWIVYIKLLNSHPWIVGKTGTKLVSQSPIDFDFLITDKKNPDNPDYAGPGREYARRYCQEKVYSDFNYVLCKNFPCVNKTH